MSSREICGSLASTCVLTLSVLLFIPGHDQVTRTRPLTKSMCSTLCVSQIAIHKSFVQGSASATVYINVTAAASSCSTDYLVCPGGCTSKQAGDLLVRAFQSQLVYVSFSCRALAVV